MSVLVVSGWVGGGVWTPEISSVYSFLGGLAMALIWVSLQFLKKLWGWSFIQEISTREVNTNHPAWKIIMTIIRCKRAHPNYISSSKLFLDFHHYFDVPWQYIQNFHGSSDNFSSRNFSRLHVKMPGQIHNFIHPFQPGPQSVTRKIALFSAKCSARFWQLVLTTSITDLNIFQC